MLKASTPISELIAIANESKENSEARYSHFRVGAALQTEGGTVFPAFNVESSSYGLSMCAERIAIWSAINSGETKFSRIAIVSDSADFCPPCGACRQILLDLAGDIEIIMTNQKGEIKSTRLSSLLPDAFTSRTLFTRGKD